MNKVKIFLLVLLIFIPTLSFAQSHYRLQSSNFFSSNNSLTLLHFGTLVPQHHNLWGLYACFLNTGLEAEVYVGKIGQISPHWFLEGGIGLERKVASTLMNSRDRFTYSYWYKWELIYKMNNWLEVGAMINTTGLGGPQIELNIPGTPVSVFVFILYSPQEGRVNYFPGITIDF